MAFAFDLASAVRATTALLWVGLGIALLRGRDALPRRVGLYFVLVAPFFAADNLVTMAALADDHPVRRAVDAGAMLAAVAAAVVFLAQLRDLAAAPREILQDRVVLTLLAIVVTTSMASLMASWGAYPGGAREERFVRDASDAFTVTLNGVAAWTAFRLASAARRDAERGRDLAWLAAGLATYPVVNAAGWADARELVTWMHPALLAIPLAVTLAAAATVVALMRVDGGRGRAPAAVLLGVALATIAALFVTDADLGDRGIARAVAFVLIAHAFRDVLFGTRTAAARRSATVTGAVGALFIVAQVAQNFLEAQYGLLMGGAVAGAFLFAAQPIQRAFEGRASTGVTGRPGDEDMYRATLRRYLADGALSRAEERHLAHLAARLGVDAGRAVELRHEVEDERVRERA